MFMNLVKNPVIIAVVAGCIVYAYMAWNRKKENEIRLKKNKKIKEENKYDNIIIPGITAVIVWFISYGYFNHVKATSGIESGQNIGSSAALNVADKQYKIANDSASATRNSFTLVNKTGGISLPTVPDMFVDFQ
jgi:heme/copper-type cytochrome/quinol oxidase subunit 2